MDLPRYARSLSTIVTLLALTAGSVTLAADSAKTARSKTGDGSSAPTRKLSEADERIAAHPLIVKAKNYRTVARFDDAARCYDEFLRTHPNVLSVELDRGLCLYWGGHRSEGVAALTVIINKHPKFYGTYVHRANMKVSFRDFDGALADVEQALKYVPAEDLESTMSCKASILRMGGKPYDALEYLQNQLKKGPTETTALQLEMAHVYRHLGMIYEADKWYKVCQNKFPDTRHEIEHAILFAATNGAETSRRLEKVFERYDSALKGGHPLADSALVFGDLYSHWYGAKEWLKSMRCAQDMLLLTGGAPEWLRYAARVDVQVRQPASALRYLKQIPDPENDPDTLEVMMLAYRAQGQLRKAKEIAEHYLELRPDNLAMRVELARIMIDDGGVRQAEEYLLRHEKKAKENLDYWATLSRCANLLGQRELACRTLDQCIRLDPKMQEYRISRALNLLYIGKTNEALLDCNQCLNLLPNTSGEYRLRAMIFDRLGNVPAAMDDYSKAIEHAGTKDAYIAYVLRGLSLAGRAEWRLSNKDVSSALKLDQKGIEAYAAFGEVNYALGLNAQAAAARDEAFKSGTRGH